MIRTILTLLTALVCLAAIQSTAFSATKADAEALVDKAAVVINSFAADPDLEWFRSKVKEAQAVLIVPQSIKGAFFVGGSGGSGTLVAYDKQTGKWSYPAFYTIGSISIGMQIGGEASEVILLVMTERGMEKLLTSSFKLGADITLAAGPIGGGASAQTADVLSYSRSKGAFAGMSLDGAVVKTRDKLNNAYYEKAVSPADIIIRKNVVNAHAEDLRQSISAVTGK